MSKYDTQYQDAKVVLFEPDRHDSKMFFASVFSYANRANVCQHAYQTTRRDLRLRREELEPILNAHGIRVRDEVLEQRNRHFSQALEDSDEVRDMGLYKHRTTNALSAALDRLEHWVGSAPRLARGRARPAAADA